MNCLYLDCETRATDNAAIIKRIVSKVKPPGSMKKEETIANWWATEGAAAKAEAVAKTALDGTWGRLAAVGYAMGDDPVQVISGNDEASLLHRIRQVINEFNMEAKSRDVLVAFNGEFDFRFLKQRFIVNHIKPPHLPLDRGDYFFDPMKEWAGYRGYISQADLEIALGIERNDPIGSGADIGAAIDAGDWASVVRHCEIDVTNLREIHRRMVI